MKSAYEKVPIPANGKQGTGDHTEILQKLSEPEVADSMVRLLDKLDSVDTMVGLMDEMMKKAPAMIEAAQAQRELTQRLSGSMELLDKLTDPQVTNTLSRLIDKLDSVDLLLSATDEFIKKGPDMLDSVQHESPFHAHMEGGMEVLSKLTQPEVTKNLVRLLDKLDTAETVLSAADEVAKKLPQMMESMEQDAQKTEVVNRYYELIGKMGEEKVVNNFHNLLDKIENLDALLNVMDEIVERNPELKQPHSNAVQHINELVEAVMSALEEEKTLLNTVKGGFTILNQVNDILLAPKMHVVVEGIAMAMQEKKDNIPEIGPLGLIRMMRDPDVKRAMGLLDVLLRSIGRQLDALDCASLPENQPK